jgi:hypothetical protein
MAATRKVIPSGASVWGDEEWRFKTAGIAGVKHLQSLDDAVPDQEFSVDEDFARIPITMWADQCAEQGSNGGTQFDIVLGDQWFAWFWVLDLDDVSIELEHNAIACEI